jgi:hypothetical protein
MKGGGVKIMPMLDKYDVVLVEDSEGKIVW